MLAPETLGKSITPQTILVSIMYANNEVGTIEPIAELAGIARYKGIWFHTDAVQAGGLLPLDVEQLGVDMLSLSGHKFYGPKGIGVLYVRQGLNLVPQLTGGQQENGRRAGTENVANIVGLATALKLAHRNQEENNRRLIALRDHLISSLLNRIDNLRLTGHPTRRLPNHASFVFEHIDGEELLNMLDQRGIAASSGSACTTGSKKPSHVLLSLGFGEDQANRSLRLTLGNDHTPEQIERVIETIIQIQEQIRSRGFRNSNRLKKWVRST